MTLFLEHHVRTAPVNLYISIHSQEPSMIFGTASSPEAFCVHIDVTQEDAGRAGPICDEKHRVLLSKEMRTFTEHISEEVQRK